MNAQELAQLVIDGAEDFEMLKETIDILVKERVARKAQAKEDAKAARDADQNAKGEIGKAWFATLKEGDAIAWTMADGSVITGTVGKQKEGAKTAHLIKDEVEEGKKADAYVPFYKLNVPAGFEMPVKAEAVA